MTSITLDIPLLIIGIIVLIWMRFKSPPYEFQVACQFIGTIWAQYSFGLSWSIQKIAILFSATDFRQNYRRYYFGLFFPLVLYVIIGGVALSFFWPVPQQTNFLYGEGRIIVQLGLFIGLVFATRAFGHAMCQEAGPILLWKALVLLGLMHGLASIYQYLALSLNLPLLAISRAHGLTLDGGVGDIAAFTIDGGDVILRPGGLAGEPKTAAVIYGMIIISLLGVPRPGSIEKKWKNLCIFSILFSIFGFIVASSTSGFISLVFAFLLLLLFNVIKIKNYFLILLIFSIIIFITDYILYRNNLPSFSALFGSRVTDRLISGENDPPVQAAIDIMSSNLFVLLFGTGIGGSTFYIQELMNSNFEYTHTPNIGIIAILIENGLVGLLLLLVPFFLLFLHARNATLKNDQQSWEIRFLLAIATSVMIFMMAGSGISMGYPIAVGAILAAANVAVR